MDLEISVCHATKRHPWKKVVVMDNPQIPQLRTNQSKTIASYNHLKVIEFPEISNQKVSVLLGLDVFNLIVGRELITGPPNTPTGVKCLLGWYVTGPHSKSTPNEFAQALATHFCDNCNDRDVLLSDQVSQWWKIETAGTDPVKEIQTVENQKALSVLTKTCCQTTSGHFETGLLWKDDSNLPYNRRLAEKHLDCLLARLTKSPEMKLRYDAEIWKDLVAGFIRKISPQEDLETKWYLPHYGITNPHKPGKLRRIANAAARYSGVCLNDKLLPGPDLLGNMLAIQMRFPENPVALQLEIEGMLMQVKVRKDDRKFLRFLWKSDKPNAIEVFEYQRHIFGARSSPTCANFALLQCAKHSQDSNPDVLKQVQMNFYMDDFVASFDSEEDAIAIQNQLQFTLARGQFKLVKWCSNSIRVCDQIDPTLLCKPVEEMFTNDNLQSVLGMQWHILTDTLAFAPPLSISKTDLSSITQRKLLSMVSQLFDPLGLEASFTIRIKILLQQTWRSGQHRDFRITDSKFCKEIKDWIDELAQFKKLEVPRQHPFGVNDSIDLHIFCDASLSATAVVAYFVFKSNEHGIRVSYAIGKARVAPLKQQTVPRLELQAAVYSTRLRTTIMNATSYPIAKVFHWTDSSSVLSWIKHPHERHKMFVANRLN